jgi:hypothetical protein
MHLPSVLMRPKIAGKTSADTTGNGTLQIAPVRGRYRA